MSIPGLDPRIIAAPAALAAVLTLRLRWQNERGVPGCGAASGCASVLTSRWAYLGPLSVSSLGSFLYLVLLAAALIMTSGVSGAGRAAAAALVVGATITLAGAFWFILLQGLVLRQFCLYCNLIHACGGVAAALVFAGVPAWTAQDHAPVLPATPALLVAAGLLAVGLLAAGQIGLRPRMYRLTELPAKTADPTAAAESRTASRPAAQEIPASEAVHASSSPACLPAGRQAVFLGGRLRLFMDHWPRLGSCDAPHVIALLFDPTCRDCQLLHRVLHQAVNQRPLDLAVLLVPVPLDPECNPAVTSRPAAPGEACGLARLLWVLWKSSPESWRAFETWLASRDRPVALAEARQQAQGLLESADWRPLWTGPDVDHGLRDGVGVYQMLGRPQLPQVLLPRGVIQGQVPTVAQLLQILDHHFRAAILAS